MSAVDTSDIPEAGEAWFSKARLVLPPPSEIRFAREYLATCQEHLRLVRFQGIRRGYRKFDIPRAEVGVKAALSWVWDAQERAGLNRDVLTPTRMGPGLVVMFVNKGARGDG